MTRNLRLKAAFIVAVILACIYGIVGLPKSKADLIGNWKKNIHLGLDLSGGTQLVMQVQLQDAFKAYADAAIQRMEDEMKKENIDLGSILSSDPKRLEDAEKIEIDVKSVPLAKGSMFRSMVNDQFGDWVLTAQNSTDYKLTLKTTEALKLKQDTMTQTMATIERKINALGLTESSVQPTGRSADEAELLIQLPGVDDPAHVKQLLQTQAVLEWDEVKDGPFASREEAMTKHGGVLPLNTKLVSGVPHLDRPGYGYSRCTRVTGRFEPLGDRVRSHSGCREAFRALHRIQHRQPGGDCGRWPGDQRPHDSEPDQRYRENHGRGDSGGSQRPGAEFARWFPSGKHCDSGGADGGSFARRRLHSGRFLGRNGRIDRRGLLHVVLLPPRRNQCDVGPGTECSYSHRGIELLRRYSDASRHRRHHSHHWYGGRQQRPDL